MLRQTKPNQTKPNQTGPDRTKPDLALRRVGIEQTALDECSERIGGVPVAHAEHGFEVATRHFFTAQKQVMQAAQCLLAHALFVHGGFKHQPGFDAGFDGLKVQQVGHEADWTQAGVRHVVCPGNQRLLAQVAPPVQVATAQAVGVGQ